MEAELKLAFWPRQDFLFGFNKTKTDSPPINFTSYDETILMSLKSYSIIQFQFWLCFSLVINVLPMVKEMKKKKTMKLARPYQE